MDFVRNVGLKVPLSVLSRPLLIHFLVFYLLEGCKLHVGSHGSVKVFRFRYKQKHLSSRDAHRWEPIQEFGYSGSLQWSEKHENWLHSASSFHHRPQMSDALHVEHQLSVTSEFCSRQNLSADFCLSQGLCWIMWKKAARDWSPSVICFQVASLDFSFNRCRVCSSSCWCWATRTQSTIDWYANRVENFYALILFVHIETGEGGIGSEWSGWLDARLGLFPIRLWNWMFASWVEHLWQTKSSVRRSREAFR